MPSSAKTCRNSRDAGVRYFTVPHPRPEGPILAVEILHVFLVPRQRHGRPFKRRLLLFDPKRKLDGSHY